MTLSVDFVRPWLLLMLPVALLPLIPRRSEALGYSFVDWLPVDSVGTAFDYLRRGCAVLAILAVVLGLAGPGRSHLQVMRVSTGAEIVILMDRSASMDGVMGKSPVVESGGMSKNEVARRSLRRFISERPDDRLAFLMFGISPVLVVPFTRNHRVIQDAIEGTSFGRGMPDTQLDRGLLAAIRQFDGQPPYAGRRAIVLVSDGGARLNARARADIRAGLARNRISLYFVYLRTSTYTSPDLTNIAPSYQSSAEAELHRYFETLDTPYRLYQANGAAAMAAAMAEINKQQKSRVSFTEFLPRQDGSTLCFAIALVCCTCLLGLRLVQVRSWS
ncbi:MAG: VWA domain-containing protein [Paraburkholderia sp.]|uniref:vWA domain-containing protein n=1 Tax=Paraburkholderia sp. TaxID=1926495 RepID=UPI0011FB6CBD|nr:vWA domain-containing protein [Paraburkholderia sp.]TAL96963.1 MAG: VWA domain-containing protein [Paraburkholderia sp.]